MTRLPDWGQRFDAALLEHMGTSFEWGRHDCALFAADMVLAVTGVDPAADLRGHTSARQALRVLRSHGGPAALASRLLGPSAPAREAVCGDVVLARTGATEGFAVCLDGQRALAPSRIGLGVIPMRDAVCCWRVG